MHERVTRPGLRSEAAALASALYAGFRFNECLGTDLVLAQEAPSTALTYLHVLNEKRTPAVLIMVGLSLLTGVMAVRKARPRRLAATGLGLLLLEDVLTVLHVPLVQTLLRMSPQAAAPDWEWLRARYIFDDAARTALLLCAAVAFVAAGVRNIESEKSS